MNEPTFRESLPLQGTASAANAIVRVRYSHDAVIDAILADPTITQGDLALRFGYTQPWLSRVMNSDAFLARLGQRKSDMVDPGLALSIDEKLRAVAQVSLDSVLSKLALPHEGQFALDVMNSSTKALGYGARQANVSVQQNFVVAMPQKAETATAWASKYNGNVEVVADATIVKEAEA